MSEKVYYAHSLEGQPPEKWQNLEEHLTIPLATVTRRQYSSNPDDARFLWGAAKAVDKGGGDSHNAASCLSGPS